MTGQLTAHSLPAILESIVRLSRELEKKPRTFGTDVLLSGREIHFIELIGQQQGLSVTDIARINGVTKGAVSQTLKRLVAKGVAIKEEDPDNISRVKIWLTNKGMRAYRAHKDWHKKEDGGYEKYLESLSTEQIAFLHQYLTRMEAFLKQRLATEE